MLFPVISARLWFLILWKCKSWKHAKQFLRVIWHQDLCGKIIQTAFKPRSMSFSNGYTRFDVGNVFPIHCFKCLSLSLQIESYPQSISWEHLWCLKLMFSTTFCKVDNFMVQFETVAPLLMFTPSISKNAHFIFFCKN